MLKLGSKEKGIGTPVRCPRCRYPNLRIDIWCERCGAPLEWNGHSPREVSEPAPPPPPPVAPLAPEAQPVLATANPIYCTHCGAAMAPGARFCQSCGGAVAGRRPHLNASRRRMPRLTVPRLRLRLPRVPRIVWVFATTLAVLLIVPLTYMVLSPGRPVAARQGTPAHPPSTNGANAVAAPAAAAIPGVEAKTGLHYRTGKCVSNAACLAVAGQTVGQDAAAVVFSTAGSSGRQCVGYVYRAGGRWQFLDAVCGLPGQLSPLLGHDATVHVPGNCANVRVSPSLKARVVACLNDATTVHIDGGPTYADGRVWWHAQRGWIGHDFLVAP